ncbi:MAG: OmpA family protein [Pseudomonadota bacterium]
MFRPAYVFACVCFIMAAVGAWYTADRAVAQFERQSEEDVSRALRVAAHDWARVKANGLTIELSGVAPDEIERFRALEIMAQVIDADRIEDAVLVIPPQEIAPPRFTLEVLRNEDRISLIGLVPSASGREEILTRLEDITAQMVVTDMLETADHPFPAEWIAALDYGLENLRQLPRSKISISSTEVTVTAVTDSIDEQQSVRSRLALSKPDGIDLYLDISAPRPVIAPFRFRLVLTPDGADLLSCSADTETTRQKILTTVAELGVDGKLRCEIGLGVPTTDWAAAIEIVVDALEEIGSGSISFADSDVTLIANETADPATFEAVIGRLESDLPELFSLNAVLPPHQADVDATGVDRTAELTAKLNLDGELMITGRIDTAVSRGSVLSVAGALFGLEKVELDTLTDADLPNTWAVRSMTAVKALHVLREGSAVVQPEKITITGRADFEQASSEVDRILSTDLGGFGNYEIDVTFDPALIPAPTGISDIECEAAIAAILDQTPLVFDAGSVILTEDSERTLSLISAKLTECPQAQFEIQGHTDSQGPDDLNLEISQSRAETVLSGLLNRRVLIDGMEAKGFGSDEPIADNETEEGRALNRRITFVLKSTLEQQARAADMAAQESVEPTDGDGAAAASTDVEVEQQSEEEESESGSN